MKKFVIKGPIRGAKGEVNISGAKNSCLPLMAASLLFKHKVVLRNVPIVEDVFTMIKLLKSLGSKVNIDKSKKILEIVNTRKHKLIVPYKLVSTMRAGVLTMGPLLGKYQNRNIYVAKSGGCSLGVRDINYHLAGFEKLGAKNFLTRGYVKIISRNGLKGSTYKFPKVTVTGTANLIMASIFLKGEQLLKNISIEPEVIDLINFLNNSGAKIEFLRNRTIRIKGVKELISANHKIIGDRIEAFSYLCVGAITKGNVKVLGVDPNFLKSELKVLKKMGCKILIGKNFISLSITKKLLPVKIKTGPYPQYATDNMPILLALLTNVLGKSEINETIFSNRFMAAPELSRMGAKILINNNIAHVQGQKFLNAAECISSDLRTTFSLILGAMSANGTSKIHRIYHGLRGYENLTGKMKQIGIKIKIEN